MFTSRRKSLTCRSIAGLVLSTLILGWCSSPSHAFGDDFSPQAIQTSAELQTNLNTFCWDMWNSYNDNSEEFYDAYREAYELLQISKRIKSATATAGSAANVKRWMLQIDSEVHHIEQHLGEFADRWGIPVSDQMDAFSTLENVEVSLDSLMTQLGIERIVHGEHEEHEGHDHEHHEEPDFAKAAVSAGELQAVANLVCITMYRDFNNESLEFLDLYKEAYELMLAAKNIKAKLESAPDVEVVHELVEELDVKIHRVESGVSAFVGRTETTNELAQSEILENIDAIEIKLHTLKQQLALEEAHEHEDDHEHAATTVNYEGTTADLTIELAIAATSLTRALEHNYKQNSDFPEAFDEINEFKNTCEQVAGMIVNEQIPDDCKRLIKGLDGEIHHLEEHVSNFTRDDTQSMDQFGRARRKLTEVEGLLHALMARAGIEKTHVD